MNQNRPLSPHLTIYKLQLTSALSIFHRATGAALTLAVLGIVFSYKVVALNMSNYSVYLLSTYLNSFPNLVSMLLLVGIVFSFYYHLLNGIRHIIWDMGMQLDIKQVYTTGYIVIFLSIFFTILTFVVF